MHKLMPYLDITNSAETESRETEFKFVATEFKFVAK